MEGDIGASQEAVRLLTSEAGLAFIKAVTDRHVPEAADGRTSANLWKWQISPLFRLVSHPHLVDSNILETEVAAVYSFLVGVNARRMKRLFDFVLGLATDWQNLSAGSEPVTKVLELSLSVLSKAIDCNTTNIVNDDFHHVVERFAGLLQGSTRVENDVSRLQADKYLDYLQRRLGVGKTMLDSQGSTPSQVVREKFVLARNLPGRLSEDGPRHDNDHAEISQIRIMPTYEEIMTSRAEYLPTTDASQWHLPGIRGRLDREFRLLREDTIGQLRDAVRDMLERIRDPGQNKHRQARNGARTSSYEHATVHGIGIDKFKGLEVIVRCRQPEVTRNMSDKDRRSWWGQSKRLQSGSLACILDAAGMVQFYVVAESTSRTGEAQHKTQTPEKEQDTQTTGDPLTLSYSQEYLFVKLNLVGASRHDTGRLLRWYREIESFPPKYLVEFPGVLLASFQHTLEALQKLSQKPDLPFVNLIAPDETVPGEEVHVSPPLFARGPGFEFDLSCLARNDRPFSVNLTRMDSADEVSARTGLDSTQSEALLNTLSRELSLIQGPPGTGKSYTGEKIIQALLANKTKAKLGPIICVCYTNHALDQVLEHLLDSGNGSIIRMGSRSKSERLGGLLLNEVARTMDLTKAEKKTKWDLKQEMRTVERDVNGLIADLDVFDSLQSVRAHLALNYPRHHDEIFGGPELDEDGFETVRRKPQNAIEQWLRGGTSPGPGRDGPRELDMLRSAPSHNTTPREREKLFRAWLREIRDPLISEIVGLLEEHRQANEAHDRTRQEIRRRCLQQADIIGVTTTGLARELNLLRKLRSKVVVCEEAGEVLEAHLLTTLLPSIEHAILIGDHQQLRPQIQNYELQSANPRGEQYSLDMSLFERLVQPPHLSDARLPVSVLTTQRRMHPSIAEMVRSTLYHQLKDGENVQTLPEVMGMGRRLFWLDHQELEAGASGLDPHSTSHSNDFEVEMAAALVSHLVRQGHYTPEDIALLTPYLGQLQRLRHRMAAEPTFSVNVDERDLEELEELDAAKSSEQVPPTKHSISKTTMLRSVRLATVDNFQGEEAKVVIISLVRSNPQNKCGFLSTSNRINVLLSRAQHGCYIIGNSSTYQHVPMWGQVIQLLQKDNNFGTSLELKCPRHPEVPMSVSKPDDFARLSPDAGCVLPCEKRLECGHACYGRCHSELLHKGIKCHEKCPRPKPGCDHACPRECGDPCEDRCNVLLKDVYLKLPCGHIVTSAKCWETQEPAAIRCQQKLDRKVPGCNHIVSLACHINITGPLFRCQAECGEILACGHRCRSPCHKCNTRTEAQVTERNHGICRQTCGRNYSACRHACPQACHGAAKCAPCEQACEVRCAHSRCARRCFEPCTPCAEESCGSRCPHTSCNMPCAAASSPVPPGKENVGANHS